MCESITDQMSNLSIKNPIPIDKDLQKIKEVCEKFVNHKVTVNVGFSFDNETYPLKDINAAGTILEDVFIRTLSKKIDITKGPNQASPDFFTADKKYEYEIKCYTNSPSFDISNFNSYINQLETTGGVYRKIFKTKYLVFEYKEESDKITITDFILLNTWDIMGYSGTYPLSLQNRNKQWLNLRPCGKSKWNDKSKTPRLLFEKIIDAIDICPNDPIKNKKDTIIKNIKDQFEVLNDKYTF